jgi:hypothetical protein
MKFIEFVKKTAQIQGINGDFARDILSDKDFLKLETEQEQIEHIEDLNLMTNEFKDLFLNDWEKVNSSKK